MNSTLRIILSWFILLSSVSALQFYDRTKVISVKSPFLTGEMRTHIDILLEFESIGLEIINTKEQHQYYLAAAHAISGHIPFLKPEFKQLQLTVDILIKGYEYKLEIPNYQVSIPNPKISYTYALIPLTDEGMAKNVYLKQAETMKNQYQQLHNYYCKVLDAMTNYLYNLREKWMYQNTQHPKYRRSVVFEDQELFYQNFQHFLVDRSTFIKSDDEFVKVIYNSSDQVVTMNWFIDDSMDLFSRDFEYGSTGILELMIERTGGVLTRIVDYKLNDITENFYKYAFPDNFATTGYNNRSEKNYNPSGSVASYEFYDIDNTLFGRIELDYNDYGNLIHELWTDEINDVIIREFESVFDPGIGSYRVTEWGSNGDIIYMDVVNSKEEIKFKKEVK